MHVILFNSETIFVVMPSLLVTEFWQSMTAPEDGGYESRLQSAITKKRA